MIRLIFWNSWNN